jgi:SAM-dependent methyltransferase
MELGNADKSLDSRAYRRLVRKLLRREGREKGMELAVGGAYEAIGRAEFDVLTGLGLTDGCYLIDVGCGSGRLAFAARGLTGLRYFGIDVVPELLEYAREKTNRPDWRFELAPGLSIPERDQAADFIAFFSVLTHLNKLKSFIYLKDAARVLRSGGTVVVSYLDAANPNHRNRKLRHRVWHFLARLAGTQVRADFLDKHTLTKWGIELGLETAFRDDWPGGQSICVYRKRT